MIRDLQDIRDVLRLFLIFGFFSKREIAMRKGIKEITYDKYKKTILNLIDNKKIHSYVNENKEKCFYIRANYIHETENPLFSIWQGKSITANDIWFLFAILDALPEHGDGMQAGEIASQLSMVSGRGIEEQTVRNRLRELCLLGIVKEERSGKRKFYKLEDGFLEDLPKHALHELDMLCAFFQNVSPIGVPGNHLRRRLTHLDVCDTASAFMFKHHRVGKTVDDETLLHITGAIRERRHIYFDLQKFEGEVVTFKRIPFLPMKLIDDVWQGRRYIAGFDEEFNKYWCFRLDKMFHVEMRHVCGNYPEREAELSRRLEKSWCVVLSEDPLSLDRLELSLQIDADKEGYVLERLYAEGKWGDVERIGPDRFVYRIEVIDAAEMIPWIRTFTGRITQIRCTNPGVAAGMSVDWRRTLSLYEGGGDYEVIS